MNYKRIQISYNPKRRCWMMKLKLMRCPRMWGKKGGEHFDPVDPPRRRANKRCGRGTYAKDRPLVVGTVGRQGGQVQSRVVNHTRVVTPVHVHRLTLAGSQLFTDENQSYNHVIHPYATVSHGDKEWAHDDDGDGIREVQVNSVESMWTNIRNFLRSFKGVHRKNLSSYISICEFRRNLKSISPDFISALVTSPSFYP